MSLFEHRKHPVLESQRDPLSTLRMILKKLEGEQEETPQIIDLKRILAGRIAELERKRA